VHIENLTDFGNQRYLYDFHLLSRTIYKGLSRFTVLDPTNCKSVINNNLPFMFLLLVAIRTRLS